MTDKGGSRQRGDSCYRQSEELKEFVRKRDNYTCQLCGEPGWQVDHIIPWAVSHDSTLANLRTLCRACNTATRQIPPQRGRKFREPRQVLYRRERAAKPHYDAYLRAVIDKVMDETPQTPHPPQNREGEGCLTYTPHPNFRGLG